MGPMIRPMAESLRFTHYVIQLVTSDLKPGDLTRRTRDGKGPSIAWIIGHLMHYRYQMMTVLGSGRPSPYKETYGDRGAGDGSDYPPPAELRAQWDDLHAELERVLEKATDGDLMAPLPEADGTHGEKKVLDSMAFYVWHEAYHMGALGAIRVEFGYPSTAELAIKAAQATT